MSLYALRRVGWWAAILTAAGCQAFESPTASVVAPIGAASSPAPWLESAMLTYVHAPGRATAGSMGTAAQAGVVQASHEADAADAPPTANLADEHHAGAVVQVLGVRYPHPDGRRDYARAELVVADAAAPASDSAGWRAKLGRFLDSATPGVEWGHGIREAKGLDVSIVELQLMLATAEQAAESGKAAQPPEGVRTAIEINGKTIPPSAAAALKLRLLALRIAREGKLISYPGSAADLLAGAARIPSTANQPQTSALNSAAAAIRPPALAASSR